MNPGQDPAGEKLMNKEKKQFIAAKVCKQMRITFKSFALIFTVLMIMTEDLYSFHLNIN